MIKSKRPPAPLTVLTDNRIKFSAEFGFYLWISGVYQNMAQHNCNLSTNIFLCNTPMHVTLDFNRRSYKRESEPPCGCKFQQKPSSFCDIRFTFSWPPVMMMRMCHCEGSQSKLLFSRLQKVRWSLLYLAVWVVSSPLWHYSTAKYFTQIWPRLLIAEFNPPKQNKQRFSPPILMFCCCHCFIQCLA